MLSTSFIKCVTQHPLGMFWRDRIAHKLRGTLVKLGLPTVSLRKALWQCGCLAGIVGTALSASAADTGFSRSTGTGGTSSTRQSETHLLPRASETTSSNASFLRALDDQAVVPPLISDNLSSQSTAPLGDIDSVGIPQWRSEADAMLSGPWASSLELASQSPGLIGSIDVGVVQPYIASKISSGTLLDGTFPGDPVTLPVGAMSFTAVPRVELGYRWPEGLGELRTSWQLVNGVGSRTIADQLPGSTRALRTHLQMNVVDFDYCFSEFNTGDLPSIPILVPLIQVPGRLGLRRPPTVDQADPLVIRFRLGIRAASMYLDAEATGTQILNERMMNNFSGAGIRAAIEGTKAMPWRSLSMYGKLDFTGLLGTTQQSFQRTNALNTSAFASQSTLNGVPCFGVDWGLQWVPTGYQNFRGTLAHQFNQWWQFADTSDSTALFQTNGLMLSGQWGF